MDIKQLLNGVNVEDARFDPKDLNKIAEILSIMVDNLEQINKTFIEQDLRELPISTSVEIENVIANKISMLRILAENVLVIVTSLDAKKKLTAYNSYKEVSKAFQIFASELNSTTKKYEKELQQIVISLGLIDKTIKEIKV